jgi:hypothetical protein
MAYLKRLNLNINTNWFRQNITKTNKNLYVLENLTI